MGKVIKSILWTLFSLIMFVVLVVGVYAIYLAVQYYRIEDNLTLEINTQQNSQVAIGEQYSISTYNIGFGAYSQDFSFFMESGEMNDGTKTAGTQSRAKDEQTVINNTSGAIRAIQNLSVDFAFFQEVDTASDRSYFVNQYQMLIDSFADYGTSFTSNFHSGYLFYPLLNPIGRVNSGIATFSKYQIESGVRKSFPIDESFPAKFFDLDRCFCVYTLPIENSDKKLILINLHMSAYDEGGVIRAQQLELLMNFVEDEYQKGNYVIAGGDWNHDIANSIDAFPSGQKTPDWVRQVTEDEIADGFSFAQATNNTATCRSTDIPYTTNEDGSVVNYCAILDGFLVSANVQVDTVENIDLDFEYSDHNPVKMSFTLLQ